MLKFTHNFPSSSNCCAWSVSQGLKHLCRWFQSYRNQSAIVDPKSSVFYTTSATTGNEQREASKCGAKKQEQFSPELQDPLGALVTSTDVGSHCRPSWSSIKSLSLSQAQKHWTQASQTSRVSINQSVKLPQEEPWEPGLRRAIGELENQLGGRP